METEYLPGDLPRLQSKNASRKNIDDAFREIDQLHQRWDQGLSIKNLALAERYLKGKLEFGIVFVPDVNVGAKSQEYVAIFERKFPGFRLPSEHGARRQMIQPRSGHVMPYSEHLVRCGYRYEQLMFVGDVETVELPKGVVHLSTVRLQPAHKFYRLCGRPRDSLNGAGLKMSFVRTYWEGCVVSGRAAAVSDKLDSEQVERRPQIVNAVAEDSRPFLGDWKVKPEAVNSVTGMRFILWDDAIRMERVEGIGSRFKTTKVFFGPVDLYANAVQGIRHGEVLSDQTPGVQASAGQSAQSASEARSKMKLRKPRGGEKASKTARKKKAAKPSLWIELRHQSGQ